MSAQGIQTTSPKRKRVSRRSRSQFTRLRFGLLLAIVSFTITDCLAQSTFTQREQNLVGGLRDRALFNLAESHCLTILTRENLTPTEFASVAIERIRIRTSQARTAKDRSVHWEMVDRIASEFASSHPNNPRSVLVGLQHALAHISFATLLRQEVEARIAKPDGREQGLKQLILARTILNQTKQKAIDTIKAQANQNLSPDMLSREQLRTLITSLEYQLAIVNLTSAQLTDASSESEKLNRLDSLGRVPDQLKAVRGAVANSKPLWWKTWIAEAACHRMLGEFSAADQILKTLKNDKRPKSTDALVLQEEIAFAIATGDRKRMQSLADRAMVKRHEPETEVALVQLLVASAKIEEASELANKVGTRHGLWWARRADIALLSGGGSDVVKSKAVGSTELQLLLEAADKAEKNGDLDAAAQGYLSVAESQFSSGERAAGLTTTVRAAMTLEKQSKHNEAATALLKPAKAYASEKLAPSIHLRGCWNLSKAKSDQFETEAMAHIRQWPESESSNQARYWLASQRLGRKEYKPAFETLVQVQSKSPQFPPSLKLARFATRKQLFALEEKGQAPRSLARQLLQSWADAYPDCSDESKPSVAVAMAELGLAWQAEDVKKSAERMKSIASLSAAKSNVEFQYLLAVLGQPKEKDQLVANANALPFDPKVVVELFLMLNRMDDSKQVSEIKLAIADNAILKTKDQKSKNQFLLARASALSELGKQSEAQEIFKQLMASDSKNPNVLLGMARVSEGERALKIWRSIASRTKQQSSAWFEAKYNVARLLHESGKSSEAAKMLKYIKAVPPGWANSELKDKFERLLRDSSD